MTSFDYSLIAVTAVLSLASIAYGFYLLWTCGTDRKIDPMMLQHFIDTAPCDPKTRAIGESVAAE